MSPRQWLRLVLVGLGASIVPLDTAVNIAFPDITHGFGLPLHMIQWVVICYVLTYASLMLAFGRIGDIFGHAPVFRVGLAWSTAAFLLCAAAPAYGWLLFCRVLQGIGAGLVISVAPALVTALFPETRRSRAVAAFTMIFAVASAAGPLIGGALVGVWGWPAVFWFRAPIALVPLAFFAAPPRAVNRGHDALDVVGAALLATTISGLLLFINEVPRFGRHDWRAFALLSLTVLGSYAFLRHETSFPAPIVKLEFFRSRSFAAINLASVLVYLTSFSVLLFMPYYLVQVAAMRLSSAGAFLAASFAGTTAASPFAGRLIQRIPANRVASAGAVLGGIGLITVGGSNIGPFTGMPAMLAALILQGFGVGLFQVAYMDAALATIPRDSRGVAGSITMLTRTLGIVSGASVLTLVFNIVEISALGAGEAPPAAFLAAFRLTLWAAGALSILSGIAVLGLSERRTG